MVNLLVQKEINDLKERQGRLERLFYSLLSPKMVDEDEIRPEYLRKIQRISRRMEQGKGITVVRTKKELNKFLKGL